jgi:16S rRNA U1498 N3-methylase RsmE
MTGCAPWVDDVRYRRGLDLQEAECKGSALLMMDPERCVEKRECVVFRVKTQPASLAPTVLRSRQVQVGGGRF